MKTTVIAAIARNGIIGKNGGLPWPTGTYPEDMAHFRDVTTGNAVVMGRKTWESLPERFRPLPGRTNYIVSETLSVHTQRHPWLFVPSLKDVVGIAEFRKHENLYIIGGSRLYTEALHIADELDLTIIGRDYEGDVAFPCGEHFINSDYVLSAWADGKTPSAWGFECFERRPGTNPDLEFTRWRRMP